MNEKTLLEAVVLAGELMLVSGARSTGWKTP